jgi:hypothetical protein
MALWAVVALLSAVAFAVISHVGEQCLERSLERALATEPPTGCVPIAVLIVLSTLKYGPGAVFFMFGAYPTVGAPATIVSGILFGLLGAGAYGFGGSNRGRVILFKWFSLALLVEASFFVILQALM